MKTKPANKLKSIFVTGTFIAFSLFIGLIAVNTFLGTPETRQNFVAFEPVISESDAQTAGTCASWTAVNLNGCTSTGYNTKPRANSCVTTNRTVSLNLKQTGASSFAWTEAPASVLCDQYYKTKPYSQWKASSYTTTSKITIPSTATGDKKICVKFNNVANACGALIEYSALGSPASLGITAWATNNQGASLGKTKGGTSIPPDRNNQSLGLGAANFEPYDKTSTFLSLGFGGSAVYSFGKVVQNVTGHDLVIYEATLGNRTAEPRDIETAQIQVSQDRSNWKVVGTASSTSHEGGPGIKKIDIASTGWPWIGYVKITDKSSATNATYNAADAFDIDALGVVKLGTQVTPTSGPIAYSTNMACTPTQKHVSANMLNFGTWNIGEGDRGDWGQGTDQEDTNLRERNKAISNLNKVPTIIAKFKERQLDIMFLQEVYAWTSELNPTDPASRTSIPDMFRQAFPREKLYFYTSPSGTSGTMITISRYPILETGAKAISGGRYISYALIDTPYGKIRGFNTHVQRSNHTICVNVAEILPYINSMVKSGESLMLSGDMNAHLDNGYFWAWKDSADGRTDRRCNATPSVNEVFNTSCINPSLCIHNVNWIDFMIVGRNGPAKTHEVCKLTPYGLHDAHELYVSTVKMK